jgi:hypothetical protein
MSIQFQLPHSSITNPTTTIFSAPFNVMTPGKYNFLDAAQNQNIISLLPGNVYLVERLSAGANVSAQDYFSALQLVTPPVITLKKRLTGEPINPNPIPIVQYFDGLELAFWIRSDKKGDFLTLSMSGIMNQTAALVGVPFVSVSISFIIWQINEKEFNSSFRNTIDAGMGKSIRGIQ